MELLFEVSVKKNLLSKSRNSLCAAFNVFASFYFIDRWKYIVSGSDIATLAYILVLIDIIMFMAMISPGMVVSEEYYCAYVGNIYPGLDLVLLLSWLSYACLSEAEVCTAGFLSSVGCCIGDLWVSYSWTDGTAACYYGSWELSLVVRPWSDGEINVIGGSCCSE